MELAAEAGVRLGGTGAIAVDERMETSLSGVFAAGDCAEAVHLVTGRPAYIPLGTTANRMGRMAGACAAGARERFGGIVGTSIVKVCEARRGRDRALGLGGAEGRASIRSLPGLRRSITRSTSRAAPPRSNWLPIVAAAGFWAAR